MFAPIDEGDESRGIDAFGRATATSGSQPGILQAGGSWGPLGRFGPEKQAHEIPCSLAHALEVVIGKTEV